MVINDISYTIDGLPLLYWRWNLGKSGQSWDYEHRVQLQERSINHGHSRDYKNRIQLQERS